jgi:hypothetical protein
VARDTVFDIWVAGSELPDGFVGPLSTLVGKSDEFDARLCNAEAYATCPAHDRGSLTLKLVGVLASHNLVFLADYNSLLKSPGRCEMFFCFDWR